MLYFPRPPVIPVPIGVSGSRSLRSSMKKVPEKALPVKKSRHIIMKLNPEWADTAPRIESQ